jgi:mRNA interferase RelE/StbE
MPWCGLTARASGVVACFGRRLRLSDTPAVPRITVGSLKNISNREIFILDFWRFYSYKTLMKTIIYTHSAVKDLDALPEGARESVIEGLSRYAITGQGDVKKMSGREGYRLRIGAYRIVFNEDAVTVLAIYIGRRSTTTYRRN